MKNNLQRFIDAQQNVYPAALTEIKQGQKRSHWMWFIFPQIQGPGLSSTSKLYAIENIEEAAEYLDHPVLGAGLIEISGALLSLQENNATKILGSPDDMKLKSSMTLFAAVPGSDPVFKAVLYKCFNGEMDNKTWRLLAIPNRDRHL